MSETAGHAPPKQAGWTARLLGAVPSAATKYNRDRCPQLAAAVSYHVLFSLVPFFMFVSGVFGVVLRDEDIRADVIEHLLARFPLTEDASVDIEEILSSVPTPASAVGLVALIALFWSAGGMMASLRVALTAAFDEGPTRPYFRSKLVDLLLVLAVATLLLVSFGTSILVHAVQRWSERVSEELGSVALNEWGLLGNLAPPFLAFIAFVALYNLVPPSHPRLRDVWLGAVVAALGVAALNVGFSYYLATVATWDLLYGSLGSILAFLFVVYLGVAIFLFGAELSSAWARSGRVGDDAEPGEPARPIRQRLIDAFVGLFVRRPS